MANELLDNQQPRADEKVGGSLHPTNGRDAHVSVDLSAHRLPAGSPDETAPKPTIDLESLEYRAPRQSVNAQPRPATTEESKSEKDPYGGQSRQQFRFDRSLARIHLILSTGVGLGVTQSAMLGFGAVGTAGVEQELTLAGGFSAACGFAAFWGVLRHFVSRTFGHEELKKVGNFTTPGYGSGVADVMLPSILVGGIGVKLFETHAVECLGLFAVVAGTVAGYHAIRYRTFLRE